MVLITPGREHEITVVCSLKCASLYVSSLASVPFDKVDFELEKEPFTLVHDQYLLGLDSESVASAARFEAKLKSLPHYSTTDDKLVVSSGREELMLNPLLLPESLYESLSDNDLVNLYDAKLLLLGEKSEKTKENSIDNLVDNSVDDSTDIMSSISGREHFSGAPATENLLASEAEPDDFMTALLARVDKARKKRDAHVSQLFAQNQDFVGWFSDIEERVGGRGASFNPSHFSRDEKKEREREKYNEQNENSSSSRASSPPAIIDITRETLPLSPDLPIDIRELEAQDTAQREESGQIPSYGLSADLHPQSLNLVSRVVARAIPMTQYQSSPISLPILTEGSETYLTCTKDKIEIKDHTNAATDTHVMVKPDLVFSSNFPTLIRKIPSTNERDTSLDLELYNQFGVFQDPFLGSDLDDDSDYEEDDVEDFDAITEKNESNSSPNESNEPTEPNEPRELKEGLTLPSSFDLHQVLFSNAQKHQDYTLGEEIRVTDDLNCAFHIQRQQQLDAFDLRAGGKETFDSLRSQIDEFLSKSSTDMKSGVSFQHPALLQGQDMTFYYPEDETQIQGQFDDQSADENNPEMIQNSIRDGLFDDSKIGHGIFGGTREEDILHLHAIFGSDDEEDGESGTDDEQGYGHEETIVDSKRIEETDEIRNGGGESDQILHSKQSFISSKSAAWALMPSKPPIPYIQHSFPSPTPLDENIYTHFEEYNGNQSDHALTNDNFNHFVHQQQDQDDNCYADFYGHNDAQYDPTDLGYEEDFEYDELQQALTNFTF